MDRLEDQLREWECKKETPENKDERRGQIKQLKQDIQEVEKALEALAVKQPAEQSYIGGMDTTFSDRDYRNNELRTIRAGMEKVPTFNPSDELAPFLIAIKNVWTA